MCLLRGTDWVFKCSLGSYLFLSGPFSSATCIIVLVNDDVTADYSAYLLYISVSWVQVLAQISVILTENLQSVSASRMLQVGCQRFPPDSLQFVSRSTSCSSAVQAAHFAASRKAQNNKRKEIRNSAV